MSIFNYKDPQGNPIYIENPQMNQDMIQSRGLIPFNNLVNPQQTQSPQPQAQAGGNFRTLQLPSGQSVQIDARGNIINPQGEIYTGQGSIPAVQSVGQQTINPQEQIKQLLTKQGINPDLANIPGLTDFLSGKRTEIPEQTQLRTQQQETLNRLASLEQELSKAQTPSKDLLDLQKAVAEQQQVLRDLTPAKYLESQPGLKNVGITQGFLERRVAAERDPIAATLQNLLMSQSFLGQEEERKRKALLDQMGLNKDVFEMQGAFSKLLPKPYELPEGAQNEIIKKFLFPQGEQTTSMREFQAAQQNPKFAEFLQTGKKDLQQQEFGNQLKIQQLQIQMQNATNAAQRTEFSNQLTQLKMEALRNDLQTPDQDKVNYLIRGVMDRSIDINSNALTKEEKRFVKNELVNRNIPIPRKLTEKEKNAQVEATGALASLDEIERIYNDNPRILTKDYFLPGVLGRFAGASQFRNAVAEATDVKTRIRTGAALNESEIAFYKSQAPIYGDKKEDVESKINQLRGFYLGTSGLPVTVVDDKGKKITFYDLFNQQQRLGLRKAINAGQKLEY